jgi:hypothetical protein
MGAEDFISGGWKRSFKVQVKTKNIFLESEKAGLLFSSLSRFTNIKQICTDISHNSCKRNTTYPMSCFGFVWNYN